MNLNKLRLPNFRTRAPWFGGDLQTIRNSLLRDRADLAPWPGTPLQVEAENGDRLSGVFHDVPNRTKPLVVLVHGLTGCEDSSYVRATARHLLAAGFAVFRFNLRGAGPSRSFCRAMYHAGRSEDLALVLKSLSAAGHAAKGMFGIGYSLGGNMLLKYLGEAGADSLISRALSVSAPLDLEAALVRLEAPRNLPYHRGLLARIKSDWRRGPLEMESAQAEVLDTATTIRAFDDGVIAPLNGFVDSAEYYAKCSSIGYLKQISVPTLLLHGANDPWIPLYAYDKAGPMSEKIRVEVVDGGGHLGFHGRGGCWYDHCAVELFCA